MSRPSARKAKALLLPLTLSVAIIALAKDPEISPPIPAQPVPWRPHKIVVFGDSLSDSNGDSYHPAESALSTFNLLKTLRGEVITLPDGTTRYPMDLAKIIGRQTTLDNIQANFDLTVKEILRKSEAKGYLGRLLDKVKTRIVEGLGHILVNVLEAMDASEDRIDKAVLKPLNRASRWIEGRLEKMDKDSTERSLFQSLGKQVSYLINFIEKDLANVILDAGDDQLIKITSKFADKIPLVPDPNYYIPGKWTTTTEVDQVWVEYLHKMMSTQDHKVTLDNRAMAGSWTLCAQDKAESLHIISELTDGITGGATMFFQGSLIPPCEGLIVQSYLNERRNIFAQEHGHTPNPGDVLIEDDTLVVFFNSANDFLNKWSDPDEVAQEHARDVWKILDAGARRVAVVLLPDISDTPRYHPDPSKPKDKESLHISNLIQKYNTSLIMRLNLLREQYHGDNGYQLVTVDGARMFKELLKEDRWDVSHPILDIAVPGTDGPVERASAADSAQPDNFVLRELKKNKGFADTFHIKGMNIQPEQSKTKFFADSVHPSSDAHYAIAAKACVIMQKQFAVPCSPDNYTFEQAKADKGKKSS
ncbi:SGNH/GDSL hydrolase family protein [Sansalvadorimonas sp. 2012CJ34-2]|uniref:SGNH/GDSL hydrolase family protein n=1 Tax=Parendozoicomonas callyspongiae TaxID=2942213 RepID=A0ABT0PCH1_9GAMM|nr:SGNH/GDSL hydrolase family protein [Sansalvadorimonas sp. 2012CJ34-2]MCL6268921.1 SGNH/GDSL hydrolase family protein [Sansalvadorimonas sp. 2012CJ34-2]